MEQNGVNEEGGGGEGPGHPDGGRRIQLCLLISAVGTFTGLKEKQTDGPSAIL